MSSWSSLALIGMTSANGQRSSPLPLRRSRQSRPRLCRVADAGGNIVYSRDERHLVALVGVQDLIVVRTEDATLVCHKGKTRNKDLVKKIGAKASYKHLT